MYSFSLAQLEFGSGALQLMTALQNVAVTALSCIASSSCPFLVCDYIHHIPLLAMLLMCVYTASCLSAVTAMCGSQIPVMLV